MDKKIELDATSSESMPPGLLRLLASLIYDSFLLFAIVMSYGGLIVLVKIVLLGNESALEYQYNPLTKTITLFGLYVSISSYFYFCWRKRGQTLGMKTWQIKLQDLNGKLPSSKQCILRILVGSIAFALFGLGFFWRYLTPQKASWQDIASETEIILVKRT